MSTYYAELRKRIEVTHIVCYSASVAIRPLLVEELAEVLGFDFTTGGLQRSMRFHAERVTSKICHRPAPSLTVVVKGRRSQLIHFFHFSVNEFPTSDRLASKQDASYYHIGECKESVKRLTLSDYAAEHWVIHAKIEDVSSHKQDGIVYLLDGEKPHFAT
jgi:hypothetical protein